MAFGITTVEFGDNVTWETLVKQSTAVERSPEIDTKLGATTELGRFPPIPYQITVTPAGLTRARAISTRTRRPRNRSRTSSRADSPLRRARKWSCSSTGTPTRSRTRRSPMGELCHFLGREFVCAIFTWPAGGSKGAFFGYDVDRESSEFAVEHLRKALRMVADTPGLREAASASLTAGVPMSSPPRSPSSAWRRTSAGRRSASASRSAT